MAEPDALKAAWAVDLPGGQPDKVGLARIVDEDGGRDEVEIEYYEAADPDYGRLEAARRLDLDRQIRFGRLPHSPEPVGRRTRGESLVEVRRRGGSRLRWLLILDVVRHRGRPSR